MPFPIYKLTRYLPIRVGISGRLHNLLLNGFSLIFPIREPINLPKNFQVNTQIANERLLFYFFWNVLLYYQKTPLFCYMKKNLTSGDIFIDIGANLGLYSHLATELGAKSYIFEPEPTHVAFLKRNPHLFSQLHDIALSNKAGSYQFYVAGPGSLGASSLVTPTHGLENSIYSHAITVQTQRLDQLMTNPNDLSKIKLIKIDVEGAEVDVVDGMQNLLEKATPPIWCEVRGEKSDRNPGSYRQVNNILETFGYKPYIFDGKCLQPFKPKHTKQVFDILFLK